MIEVAHVLRRSSRYGNRWYDDDSDGDDGTSPFLLGENFVFARNYNFSFIINFAKIRSIAVGSNIFSSVFHSIPLYVG